MSISFKDSKSTFKFPQPPAVQEASAKAREEWWNMSKRLQADSLVFLADHQGCAVFCTSVRAQIPPVNQDGNDLQNRQREDESLWKDEKKAPFDASSIAISRDGLMLHYAR